jgi:HrpA-like RNA helicase
MNVKLILMSASIQTKKFAQYFNSHSLKTISIDLKKNTFDTVKHEKSLDQVFEKDIDKETAKQMRCPIFNIPAKNNYEVKSFFMD